MKVQLWTPPKPPAHPRQVVLTERLAQVLTLICQGCSDADIAARLFISSDTAKTHMRRLLRAMGARNRQHAVALAVTGQVVVLVRIVGWREAA